MEETIASQKKNDNSGSDMDIEELVSTLPQFKITDTFPLYQYQGFWAPTLHLMKGIIFLQNHFQARDSDIILASNPKSGTTWLKALTFAIMSRSHHAMNETPLLTKNPHELSYFLERKFMENPSMIEQLSNPRILATHVPYSSLPQSIVNNKCKIVYICRNPLDQLVSIWHFIPRHYEVELIPLEKFFDLACQGIQPYGPFDIQMLGYWNASSENPDRVLFLKYEDLKKDINFQIKKLAKFLGCAISSDEENRGVVEEIARLCSFEHLKGLEVNKSGQHMMGRPNHAFFRKGEIGDSKNYFTPSTLERFEKLVEDKLCGSGLNFKEETKRK